MNTATTSPSWQSILTASADEAYDQLADALRLPRISTFPRPGDARTWTISDWIKWGSDHEFVAGPKTRHTQMVQHRLWPVVSVNPSNSVGDPRSAMNCAQDGRNSLIAFLERARLACRVLAEDGEQPGDDLSLWLMTKLSGAAGQTLMERTKKVAVAETDVQSEVAHQLLKRLKAYYPSVRAALIDIGCSEHTADRLILLNKGKIAWTFMGMAEQLIPVMRLVLSDHVSEANRAKGVEPAAEPEVLGPAEVAEVVAAQPELVQPLQSDQVEDPELEISTPQGRGISAAVAQSLKDLNKLLVKQSTVIDRAAQEIPEFVRGARQRNTVFYKQFVNEMIEFQARQHAAITRQETSDLFAQLAEMQQEMAQFRTNAQQIQRVIDMQTAYIEKNHGLLSRYKELHRLQQQQIAELEDKLTDPKITHMEQKLKDIRGLLEGKLDVFELVNNVDRVKKMLDALIKRSE